MWVHVLNVWRMRPINNWSAVGDHMTVWEVTAFPVSTFDRLRDNSTCLANWIGALVALQRGKKKMNPSLPPSYPPLYLFLPLTFTTRFREFKEVSNELVMANSFYFMFESQSGRPAAELINHHWCRLKNIITYKQSSSLPFFHESTGKVIFWRRRGEGQESRLLKLLTARQRLKDTTGSTEKNNIKETQNG